MATTTTATLANEYQKYFSKKLLEHAIQEVVLDQFALKQPLPKKVGAKIISFFRRSASVTNPLTGRVDAVQTLTEGVPISTFTDATLYRVDVPLIQYGEATKITDIATMTELFDALQQNKDLMAEDCALNADSITRDVLVAATNTGITQNTATGTFTEKIGQICAQAAPDFATLAAASTSGGKAVATDYLRAATQLQINRAKTWDGKYVAVINPQMSHDLQNDPDWIDAANYGDATKRFRGELGTMYGVRFVIQTNSFIEDGTGSQYVCKIATAQSDRIYRTFILGKGSFGVSAMEGESPYSPRVMVVNQPDKSDPLNQFMTAGWKAYWGASALNPKYAISLSSKTEFVGTP